MTHIVSVECGICQQCWQLQNFQNKKCNKLLQAAKNKNICASHLPVFIIALSQWSGIASTATTCLFIRAVADRFLGHSSNIKGNDLVDKTGFCFSWHDTYCFSWMCYTKMPAMLAITNFLFYNQQYHVNSTHNQPKIYMLEQLSCISCMYFCCFCFTQRPNDAFQSFLSFKLSVLEKNHVYLTL